FNAWTQMPTVNEQMALEGSFAADFFAPRFLLRKGRAYQAAVEQLSRRNRGGRSLRIVPL
ncbi:MAG: hypothetical protein WBW78_00740, partial [Terrimicrobiaceae bacterium]